MWMYNVNTVVSTHSTGIREATVYYGQVFYEKADKMRFAATKDLNALVKVLLIYVIPIVNKFLYSSLEKSTINLKWVKLSNFNLMLLLDVLS